MQYSISGSRTNLRINMVLILFFAVSFAVYFIAMPPCLDDYWYSQQLYDWLEGDSDRFPLKEIIDTWKHHWQVDNVRLANIVYVPFLLLPHWSGALLCASGWVYAFLTGMRLSGITRCDNALVAVVLFLLAFMLPWYDSMGGLCYQFNYILSSAISVAVLYMFYEGNSRGLSLFLAGLLLGSWHEAFGIPVLSGVVAVMALVPAYRSRRNMMLVAGIACGTLWLLSAPGFLIRLNDVSGAMPLNINKATVVLCTHPSFMIMLIMTVVLISGKRTDILRNKLVILLMVSAICSVCIHLNSTRSPRSGWWGEFCSILLVVYFLDRLLSPVWKRCRNGKALWYVVPVSVLIVMHMVVVDYYSVRIGRTFDGVVDAYRKDRCRTVYADFITEYDAPLISMLAPDFTLFTSLYNIHFVNMYFGTVGDECEFRVIPSEFRDLTAESGEPVGGNMGVRRVGNHLFAPVEFLSNREIAATADFGFGPRKVRIFCYPFVSDKDGRRYAYLYLWRSVTDMRVGELRSINK